MEIYTVTETRTTPLIRFDASKGTLEIKGVSIPEYPKEFYEPLQEVLERYIENPNKTTALNFSLIYFNSSSTRSLLNILNIFKGMDREKGEVRINWYYDSNDDDQLETIKDLEALVGIEFNYIAV